MIPTEAKKKEGGIFEEHGADQLYGGFLIKREYLEGLPFVRIAQAEGGPEVPPEMDCLWTDWSLAVKVIDRINAQAVEVIDGQ